MLMKQKARLEEAAKAKEETKVHLDIRKNADCEIELRRRITAEQFFGRKTEERA